jgi:DNA-3-methyladenine glycosylase II
MPLGTRRRASISEHQLPVVPPYRLDLTATVLRRFSTNVVDVLGPGGVYRRALAMPGGPLVVEVAQPAQDMLRLTVAGPLPAHEAAPALVRRMLGADVHLGRFDRASAKVPWLAALARRMLGVRPPRYPTLWEACVNAVVFQQISLIAASAIMRRVIEALGTAVPFGGGRLFAFPEPAVVAATDASVLRAAGLSAAKTAAILGIGRAFSAGTLTEQALEGCSSAEAALELCRLRGIGPWTAAVILLRGLGRLDVFPENDSGAARSLAYLGGGKPVATAPVLEQLGDQRGMLYYHLLLARLEARGDLASPPLTRNQ